MFGYPAKELLANSQGACGVTDERGGELVAYNVQHGNFVQR